jgi:hypothetical protein
LAVTDGSGGITVGGGVSIEVDRGVNTEVGEGAAAADGAGGVGCGGGGGGAVDIAELVVDVVVVVCISGIVVDVAIEAGVVGGSLEVVVLLCRKAKGSSICDRTSPGGGGGGRKSGTPSFSILALPILSVRAWLSLGVPPFALVFSGIETPLDTVSLLAAIRFSFSERAASLFLFLNDDVFLESALRFRRNARYCRIVSNGAMVVLILC